MMLESKILPFFMKVYTIHTLDIHRHQTSRYGVIPSADSYNVEIFTPLLSSDTRLCKV